MFTNVASFESLNTLQNIQDGEYRETASCYQSTDGLINAVIKEFRRVDTNFICACDLLIVLPNQDVLFRDFMLMPDRTWRDSYGNRADRLPDLLPSELSDFRLISRNDSNFTFSKGNIVKLDLAMYGLEP